MCRCQGPKPRMSGSGPTPDLARRNELSRSKEKVTSTHWSRAKCAPCHVSQEWNEHYTESTLQSFPMMDMWIACKVTWLATVSLSQYFKLAFSKIKKNFHSLKDKTMSPNKIRSCSSPSIYPPQESRFLSYLRPTTPPEPTKFYYSHHLRGDSSAFLLSHTFFVCVSTLDMVSPWLSYLTKYNRIEHNSKSCEWPHTAYEERAGWNHFQENWLYTGQVSTWFHGHSSAPTLKLPPWGYDGS